MAVTADPKCAFGTWRISLPLESSYIRSVPSTSEVNITLYVVLQAMRVSAALDDPPCTPVSVAAEAAAAAAAAFAAAAAAAEAVAAAASSCCVVAISSAAAGAEDASFPAAAVVTTSGSPSFACIDGHAIKCCRPPTRRLFGRS